MRNYKIAAIPADGIGPEVISAGVEVLHALTRHDPQLKFDVETFDWGRTITKTWRDDAGRRAEHTKKFDAIYFGAVGAPDVPDHITLWGLRLPICGGLTSTPTCVQPKSCRVSPHRCATAGPAILTG